MPVGSGLELRAALQASDATLRRVGVHGELEALLLVDVVLQLQIAGVQVIVAIAALPCDLAPNGELRPLGGHYVRLGPWDQQVSRDVKSLAKLADHGHAEFALAIHDFTHSACRAEKRY